jgi:hypothetical protein
MSTKPQRNLARLPKWAQNEITRLRADLEYNEKKLAAGPADSLVFADPYSDTPRPLGNPTVEFGTERGRRFRVRLDADGLLEVSSDEGLKIQPRASNVIRLLPGRERA